MAKGTVNLGRKRIGLRNNPFAPREASSPSPSIVIGFVGEFQSPFDSETGMHQMVMQLYEQGYDARIFDEDDVGTDLLPTRLVPLSWAGEERAVEALLNASIRGVQDMAIFGYSHGGGATYELAGAIFENWPEDLDALDLKFTGYIDGVEKGFFTEEFRLPPGTDHHHNLYQQALWPDIWDWESDFPQGGPVDGATNDDVQSGEEEGGLLFEDAEHTNGDGFGIAEHGPVQERMVTSLEEHLPDK